MTIEQIGEKIAEISTDIKWIIGETKRINGSFTTHLEESDKFRTQVTRNTIWRWCYKIAIGGIIFVIWHKLFR